MSPSRTLLVLAGTLLAVALLASPSSSGPLRTRAMCDGDRIHIEWNWYEDPTAPTGDPEWTGYDVYRRTTTPCGEWVRVNELPYPRTMGVDERFAHEDVPPSPESYEYRVMLVRDDRTQAPYPSYAAWDGSSCQRAWTGCPVSSVPVTEGTLVDWHWALYVNACPGTCLESGYFDDVGMVQALRPYIGSTVRLFGAMGCGSIEGPSIMVDHFELAPCSSIVPARPTTWGRLKAIYR